MTEGLAPQNICSGSGGEFVSRVGLAAFEPLGSERAAEPVDAIAHPPFEPTEGQIIPLPADCCPTTGNPPVAESHFVPHNPDVTDGGLYMGTGQAAPSIEVARGQELRSSLKGPSQKFAPVTWQRSDVPFDPFRRDATVGCSVHAVLLIRHLD
jgi:hypothetical protein